jgi:hypothetical protein
LVTAVFTGYKEWFMKKSNSIIKAVLSVGIIVFLASCLNPVGFDPSNIQLKIDAKVSGEVDVRSTDSAILWVINRTSSVDVTKMTISRTGTETKVVEGKPAPGSTHASYHEPTDVPYKVEITYALSPDNTNPAFTAANSNGTITIEKYMPKAGANYRIYLYRANDGQVGQTVVVEDETITKPLDPSDTENPIEPPAADTPTYPLIIRNVTSDLQVATVTFSLGDRELNVEGPRPKDEVLWYFEAGQYKVVVPYSNTATVEKNVPIIKPNDSQSWHTLYLWIYKTKTGGYATTTSWPPNPNDAADVSIDDVAGPDKGILQIINKSESSDVIQKIRIDGTEVIPFGTLTTPSFTKDIEWMKILDPGIHTVEFMPSRQNYYGMTLTVDIKAGAVTAISYYDRLSDPDLSPPEVNGYGSGLIKIINNSTGVVNSVFIRDVDDDNKFKTYKYEQFTPPDPINYTKTGRVGVVGDAQFPLTAGAHYLIQVALMLPEEQVIIERLAALKDQVVEIVINEEEIHKVHGANITLSNTTSSKPVQITSVALRNASNPGEASSFSGQSWSPSGNVNKGSSAGFRVNSSINMPIRPGYSFDAYVAIIGGNGVSAVVKKNVGTLYDTSRTITITDGDVPPELVETFVPVTGISVPGTLLSVVDPQNARDPAKSNYATINLNDEADVTPSGASVKSPITWEKVGGTGKDYVTLNNGVLEVIPFTGNTVTSSDISARNDKTVTLKATIPNAAGALSSKTDYVRSDITITLKFVTTSEPNNPVSRIDVNGSGDPIELLIGDIASLTARVTVVGNGGDTPIVNGSAVTAADILWSVSAPSSSYVKVVNSAGQAGGTTNYVMGIAAGTASVTGTIPSTRTGTGSPITVSVPVNVKEPPITSKTLRFIRAAGLDSLDAIVLVNTQYSGYPMMYTPSPTDVSNYTAFINENGSNTTAYTGRNTGGQPPVWQTGQTGHSWMNDANSSLYIADNFKRAFSSGQYVTYLGNNPLKLGNVGPRFDTRLGTDREIHLDYEVTLGPEGTNKYFIFFMEGDSTRGTSDGSFTPAVINRNFYFFVDLDKLPEVTRNGEKVVPIFYDSYHNLASIGINFNNTPATNRKYPPLRSYEYDGYSFDD